MFHCYWHWFPRCNTDVVCSSLFKSSNGSESRVLTFCGTVCSLEQASAPPALLTQAGISIYFIQQRQVTVEVRAYQNLCSSITQDPAQPGAELWILSILRCPLWASTDWLEVNDMDARQNKQGWFLCTSKAWQLETDIFGMDTTQNSAPVQKCPTNWVDG